MIATYKGNEIDIKITEITLLTLEEAEKVPKELLAVGEYWWLRSPSQNPKDTTSVLFVNPDGSFDTKGRSPGICNHIRPVLKISNLSELGLAEGDTFSLAGYTTWTVIPGDMALYDKTIDSCPYRTFTGFEMHGSVEYCYDDNGDGTFSEFPRSELRDYDKSDAKSAVDYWASKNGVKTEGKGKKKYYVIYHVTARYMAEVDADDLDEALELAEEKYVSADFGEAEDIEGEAFAVDDENDNRLWEAD